MYVHRIDEMTATDLLNLFKKSWTFLPTNESFIHFFFVIKSFLFGFSPFFALLQSKKGGEKKEKQKGFVDPPFQKEKEGLLVYKLDLLEGLGVPHFCQLNFAVDGCRKFC